MATSFALTRETIMGPMNQKAPCPNGFEAGERIGDPVPLLGEAKGRRTRGRFVRGGGDQRPDRRLVRLPAEIGLHEPGPAAAGQNIVGLERGRRGLGRLEALDDQIGDGAGAPLVADEAHHVGGVVGRQAFEHAKLIQAKPNKTKQKSLDFLGFLRPNRDFSMGYGESK